MLKADLAPSAPAMWTSRLALFSAGLVLATLAMHRLFWMPTPVALNLFAVSYGLASLAVLLALAAIVIIWRRGSPGVSRVLFGLVVSGALFAWPATLLPAFSSLPAINDITTDTRAPPAFATLAKVRAETGGNGVKHPGARFAQAQAAAYPDIAPMPVERSVEETYELVVATLQRMKMRIVHEEIPDPRSGRPGLVEATDRTLVLGFIDDIVMRVSGDQRRAVVDFRSASRYGRHDLGRNAVRIRAIAKELAARIDATVPVPASEPPRVATAIPKRDIKGKIDKLVPRRQKVRDPTIIAPQPLPDPARADAPRGPEPKGKQRPQGDRRDRDKR